MLRYLQPGQGGREGGASCIEPPSNAHTVRWVGEGHCPSRMWHKRGGRRVQGERRAYVVKSVATAAQPLALARPPRMAVKALYVSAVSASSCVKSTNMGVSLAGRPPGEPVVGQTHGVADAAASQVHRYQDGTLASALHRRRAAGVIESGAQAGCAGWLVGGAGASKAPATSGQGVWRTCCSRQEEQRGSNVQRAGHFLLGAMRVQGAGRASDDGEMSRSECVWQTGLRGLEARARVRCAAENAGRAAHSPLPNAETLPPPRRARCAACAPSMSRCKKSQASSR